MKLVIDSKEKAQSTAVIINYLKSVNFECEQRNLDVGDLAIVDDKDQIIAIFERKTCEDMAASLNDGRYREQKIRLLSSDYKWKGYIVEGIFPNKGISFPTRGKRRVVAKTTYYSIITGITLRDGLDLYQTENIEETAKLLGQMLKKIPDYMGKNTVNYEQELIKSVSTVRKQNMTPQVCYLAQLCQIPGVSHKIATCIQSKWSSMAELLDATQYELSEINIGERRLGKVLGLRIVEYMKPKTVEVKVEPKIKTKIKVMKK